LLWTRRAAITVARFVNEKGQGQAAFNSKKTKKYSNRDDAEERGASLVEHQVPKFYFSISVYAHTLLVQRQQLITQ
jgi:hypothetical protein